MQSLTHPFFDDIFIYENAGNGLRKQINKKDLFNFSKEEINSDKTSMEIINSKIRDNI